MATCLNDFDWQERLSACMHVLEEAHRSVFGESTARAGQVDACDMFHPVESNLHLLHSGAPALDDAASLQPSGDRTEAPLLVSGKASGAWHVQALCEGLASQLLSLSDQTEAPLSVSGKDSEALSVQPPYDQITAPWQYPRGRTEAPLPIYEKDSAGVVSVQPPRARTDSPVLFYGQDSAGGLPVQVVVRWGQADMPWSVRSLAPTMRCSVASVVETGLPLWLRCRLPQQTKVRPCLGCAR
eukprot:6490966-Amphidinium_carterae.4